MTCRGASPSRKPAETESDFRMFLIPCSCGASFSVAADYDRKGMHIRSFLACPQCGKRHDPRNRLLQLAFDRQGYWKVDAF